MCSLPHSNIAQVQAVAKDNEGNWFVEMKQYKWDLRRWMDEAGLVGLSPDDRSARVKTVAVGLLQGLEFLHLRGIIHGDLKPENVVLNLEEEAVIIDFDTSKVESLVTKTGVLFGTPGYIHPDLFRGKTFPCKETDLYSFGVLFSELLGQIPINKNTDNGK